MLCKAKEQSPLAFNSYAQDMLRRQTEEDGVVTTMLDQHLSACGLVGMTLSMCTAADLLGV